MKCKPELLSEIGISKVTKCSSFPAFNCYGCSSDTSPTPEGTQTCIDSPQDIPDTQGRIIQCLPFANDTVIDIWEWKCYTAHILEKSVNSKLYSTFRLYIK